MDGYEGSDDILEKLKYANQGPPIVDLYWGEVCELLREAEEEIERLRMLEEYFMGPRVV